MTPLAQALNTALLHFIWQGIAIGLLLWIALFLLRSRSANARYVASCGALILLACAPVATAWSAYTPQAEVAVSWKMVASAVTARGLDLPVGPPSGRIPGLHGLESWILPVWGVGVVLFALRLMWCWRHTSALCRAGTPADSPFLAMVSRAAERIGVTRSIRVLMSAVTEVPSVIGWVRPVLLLPVAVAAGLTPQQLEAVIAHELAHIRRHDYLVNLAQTVVETVLFYHPVVWWVSSKIRYERELCCDDLAVAALGDAALYARALARLEEVRVFQPSLAMGAADGPLFHRIERLLGGGGNAQGPSRLACAIGLLVGVACLALSMGWAQGRQNFVPPRLPVPAAPPLPSPARISPIPPVPSVPPVPPVFASVSPALLEALQRVVPGAEDVPWVLFRGDGVRSSGSSADEAEARAARQASGGGDALWFRLDGKAYMTQDKATLDRIAEADAPAQALADTQALIQRQVQATIQLRSENERRQVGMQADLQAALAALKAQVPNDNPSLEQLNSVRKELEKVRRGLDEMAAKLHQQELAVLQENINVQREAERSLIRAEATRQSAPQIPDVLRDAVNSGKARPVQ